MEAVEILQNHQLKKTTPRVAIIQALQTSKAPLSENEVKEKMGNLYDRITFYRSVQTLMEVGIIHRIIVDNITTRYALNFCNNKHQHIVDHVHFFCQQCNSLICLNDVKLQNYQLPNEFIAEQCEVTIKGLCDKCSDIK